MHNIEEKESRESQQGFIYLTSTEYSVKTKPQHVNTMTL
ncbi:hypothetical protein THF1D04_110120 [Vibrio owensii]|uniref:Uncharacterized protein n=1 Tax=Vibrio owensii TaxID=696485 RepID=A0AAU9Q1G6_9VIBR|nr:hypothetical protein THF1D04_110120 [Vibrio owensii]